MIEPDHNLFYRWMKWLIGPFWPVVDDAHVENQARTLTGMAEYAKGMEGVLTTRADAAGQAWLDALGGRYVDRLRARPAVLKGLSEYAQADAEVHLYYAKGIREFKTGIWAELLKETPGFLLDLAVPWRRWKAFERVYDTWKRIKALDKALAAKLGNGLAVKAALAPGRLAAEAGEEALDEVGAGLIQDGLDNLSGDQQGIDTEAMKENALAGAGSAPASVLTKPLARAATAGLKEPVAKVVVSTVNNVGASTTGGMFADAALKARSAEDFFHRMSDGGAWLSTLKNTAPTSAMLGAGMSTIDQTSKWGGNRLYDMTHPPVPEGATPGAGSDPGGPNPPNGEALAPREAGQPGAAPTNPGTGAGSVGAGLPGSAEAPGSSTAPPASSGSSDSGDASARLPGAGHLGVGGDPGEGSPVRPGQAPADQRQQQYQPEPPAEEDTEQQASQPPSAPAEANTPPATARPDGPTPVEGGTTTAPTDTTAETPVTAVQPPTGSTTGGVIGPLATTTGPAPTATAAQKPPPSRDQDETSSTEDHSADDPGADDTRTEGPRVIPRDRDGTRKGRRGRRRSAPARPGDNRPSDNRPPRDPAPTHGKPDSPGDEPAPATTEPTPQPGMVTAGAAVQRPRAAAAAVPAPAAKPNAAPTHTTAGDPARPRVVVRTSGGGTPDNGPGDEGDGAQGRNDPSEPGSGNDGGRGPVDPPVVGPPPTGAGSGRSPDDGWPDENEVGYTLDENGHVTEVRTTLSGRPTSPLVTWARERADELDRPRVEPYGLPAGFVPTVKGIRYLLPPHVVLSDDDGRFAALLALVDDALGRGNVVRVRTRLDPRVGPPLGVEVHEVTPGTHEPVGTVLHLDVQHVPGGFAVADPPLWHDALTETQPPADVVQAAELQAVEDAIEELDDILGDGYTRYEALSAEAEELTETNATPVCLALLVLTQNAIQAHAESVGTIRTLVTTMAGNPLVAADLRSNLFSFLASHSTLLARYETLAGAVQSCLDAGVESLATSDQTEAVTGAVEGVAQSVEQFVRAGDDLGQAVHALAVRTTRDDGTWPADNEVTYSVGQDGRVTDVAATLAGQPPYDQLLWDQGLAEDLGAGQYFQVGSGVVPTATGGNLYLLPSGVQLAPSRVQRVMRRIHDARNAGNVALVRVTYTRRHSGRGSLLVEVREVTPDTRRPVGERTVWAYSHSERPTPPAYLAVSEGPLPFWLQVLADARPPERTGGRESRSARADDAAAQEELRHARRAIDGIVDRCLEDTATADALRELESGNDPVDVLTTSVHRYESLGTRLVRIMQLVQDNPLVHDDLTSERDRVVAAHVALVAAHRALNDGAMELLAARLTDASTDDAVERLSSLTSDAAWAVNGFVTALGEFADAMTRPDPVPETGTETDGSPDENEVDPGGRSGEGGDGARLQQTLAAVETLVDAVESGAEGVYLAVGELHAGNDLTAHLQAFDRALAAVGGAVGLRTLIDQATSSANATTAVEERRTSALAALTHVLGIYQELRDTAWEQDPRTDRLLGPTVTDAERLRSEAASLGTEVLAFVDAVDDATERTDRVVVVDTTMRAGHVHDLLPPGLGLDAAEVGEIDEQVQRAFHRGDTAQVLVERRRLPVGEQVRVEVREVTASGDNRNIWIENYLPQFGPADGSVGLPLDAYPEPGTHTVPPVGRFRAHDRYRALNDLDVRRALKQSLTETGVLDAAGIDRVEAVQGSGKPQVWMVHPRSGPPYQLVATVGEVEDDAPAALSTDHRSRVLRLTVSDRLPAAYVRSAVVFAMAFGANHDWSTGTLRPDVLNLACDPWKAGEPSARDHAGMAVVRDLDALTGERRQRSVWHRVLGVETDPSRTMSMLELRNLMRERLEYMGLVPNQRYADVRHTLLESRDDRDLVDRNAAGLVAMDRRRAPRWYFARRLGPALLASALPITVAAVIQGTALAAIGPVAAILAAEAALTWTERRAEQEIRDTIDAAVTPRSLALPSMLARLLPGRDRHTAFGVDLPLSRHPFARKWLVPGLVGGAVALLTLPLSGTSVITQLVIYGVTWACLHPLTDRRNTGNNERKVKWQELQARVRQLNVGHRYENQLVDYLRGQIARFRRLTGLLPELDQSTELMTSAWERYQPGPTGAIDLSPTTMTALLPQYQIPRHHTSQLLNFLVSLYVHSMLVRLDSELVGFDADESLRRSDAALVELLADTLTELRNLLVAVEMSDGASEEEAVARVDAALRKLVDVPPPREPGTRRRDTPVGRFVAFAITPVVVAGTTVALHAALGGVVVPLTIVESILAISGAQLLVTPAARYLDSLHARRRRDHADWAAGSLLPDEQRLAMDVAAVKYLVGSMKHAVEHQQLAGTTHDYGETDDPRTHAERVRAAARQAQLDLAVEAVSDPAPAAAYEARERAHRMLDEIAALADTYEMAALADPGSPETHDAADAVEQAIIGFESTSDPSGEARRFPNLQQVDPVQGRPRGSGTHGRLDAGVEQALRRLYTDPAQPRQLEQAALLERIRWATDHCRRGLAHAKKTGSAELLHIAVAERNEAVMEYNELLRELRIPGALPDHWASRSDPVAPPGAAVQVDLVQGFDTFLAELGSADLTAGEHVDRVAGYFATLTAHQAEALGQLRPEQVGELDGAPHPLRYAVNRQRLVTERNRLAADHDPEDREAVQARRELVRSMLAPAPLTAESQEIRPRRFLSLSFEGNGRFVEVLGDLGSARQVTMHVPGAGVPLERVDRLAETAQEVRDEVGSGTASVIAQCYDSPDDPGSAAGTASADTAVAPLNRLVAAVDHAAPNGSTMMLTGHSYGGVAVAQAVGAGVCRGAERPLDVVFLGTPGLPGVKHTIFELRPAEGLRFWAARDPFDYVAYTRAHGADPAEVHGVTRLRTVERSDVDHSVSGFARTLARLVVDGWDTVRWHNAYMAPHSTSLRNLGRIARGELSAVSEETSSDTAESQVRWGILPVLSVSRTTRRLTALAKLVSHLRRNDDAAPSRLATVVPGGTTLALHAGSATEPRRDACIRRHYAGLHQVNAERVRHGTHGAEFTQNCSRAVIATDAYLAGNLSSAAPFVDGYHDDSSATLEDYFGARFSRMQSYDHIARNLRPGDRGIVWMGRGVDHDGNATGHAVNVHHDGSTLVYLDGQTNEIATLDPSPTDLALLVTGNGTDLGSHHGGPAADPPRLRFRMRGPHLHDPEGAWPPTNRTSRRSDDSGRVVEVRATLHGAATREQRDQACAHADRVGAPRRAGRLTDGVVVTADDRLFQLTPPDVELDPHHLDGVVARYHSALDRHNVARVKVEVADDGTIYVEVLEVDPTSGALESSYEKTFFPSSASHEAGTPTYDLRREPPWYDALDDVRLESPPASSGPDVVHHELPATGPFRASARWTWLTPSNVPRSVARTLLDPTVWDTSDVQRVEASRAPDGRPRWTVHPDGDEAPFTFTVAVGPLPDDTPAELDIDRPSRTVHLVISSRLPARLVRSALVYALAVGAQHRWSGPVATDDHGADAVLRDATNRFEARTGRNPRMTLAYAESPDYMGLSPGELKRLMQAFVEHLGLDRQGRVPSTWVAAALRHVEDTSTDDELDGTRRYVVRRLGPVVLLSAIPGIAVAAWTGRPELGVLLATAGPLGELAGRYYARRSRRREQPGPDDEQRWLDTATDQIETLVTLTGDESADVSSQAPVDVWAAQLGQLTRDELLQQTRLDLLQASENGESPLMAGVREELHRIFQTPMNQRLDEQVRALRDVVGAMPDDVHEAVMAYNDLLHELDIPRQLPELVATTPSDAGVRPPDAYADQLLSFDLFVAGLTDADLSATERVDRVSDHFAGLAEHQAHALCWYRPDVVGELDGAPLPLRYTANWRRLRAERRRLVMDSPPGHDDLVTGRLAMLGAMLAPASPDGRPRQLLSVRLEGSGRFVEVVGDIGAARQVHVHVTAADAETNGLDGQLTHATLISKDVGHRTATVVSQACVAPTLRADRIPAVDATTSAATFNRLVAGVDHAAARAAAMMITATGHGAVVVCTSVDAGLARRGHRDLPVVVLGGEDVLVPAHAFTDLRPSRGVQIVAARNPFDPFSFGEWSGSYPPDLDVGTEHTPGSLLRALARLAAENRYQVPWLLIDAVRDDEVLGLLGAICRGELPVRSARRAGPLWGRGWLPAPVRRHLDAFRTRREPDDTDRPDDGDEDDGTGGSTRPPDPPTPLPEPPGGGTRPERDPHEHEGPVDTGDSLSHPDEHHDDEGRDGTHDVEQRGHSRFRTLARPGAGAVTVLAGVVAPDRFRVRWWRGAGGLTALAGVVIGLGTGQGTAHAQAATASSSTPTASTTTTSGTPSTLLSPLVHRLEPTGIPPAPPPPPPDKGSGPYNSETPTPQDHLHRYKLRAIAVGGLLHAYPDASAHLQHYVNGSGLAMHVDPDDIAHDLPRFEPLATGLATTEINRVAQDAASRAQYGLPIPFTTDWRVIPAAGTKNWFYALGNFSCSATGTVTVHPPSTPSEPSRVEAQYKIHVYDRYDWDPDALLVGPLQVPDAVNARLHRVGLARDFDIMGSSAVRHYKGFVPPGTGEQPARHPELTSESEPSMTDILEDSYADVVDTIGKLGIRGILVTLAAAGTTYASYLASRHARRQRIGDVLQSTGEDTELGGGAVETGRAIVEVTDAPEGKGARPEELRDDRELDVAGVAPGPGSAEARPAGDGQVDRTAVQLAGSTVLPPLVGRLDLDGQHDPGDSPPATRPAADQRRQGRPRRRGHRPGRDTTPTDDGDERSWLDEGLHGLSAHCRRSRGHAERISAVVNRLVTPGPPSHVGVHTRLLSGVATTTALAHGAQTGVELEELLSRPLLSARIDHADAGELVRMKEATLTAYRELSAAHRRLRDLATPREKGEIVVGTMTPDVEPTGTARALADARDEIRRQTHDFVDAIEEFSAHVVVAVAGSTRLGAPSRAGDDVDTRYTSAQLRLLQQTRAVLAGVLHGWSEDLAARWEATRRAIDHGDLDAVRTLASVAPEVTKLLQLSRHRLDRELFEMRRLGAGHDPWSGMVNQNYEEARKVLDTFDDLVTAHHDVHSAAVAHGVAITGAGEPSAAAAGLRRQLGGLAAALVDLANATAAFDAAVIRDVTNAPEPTVLHDATAEAHRIAHEIPVLRHVPGRGSDGNPLPADFDPLQAAVDYTFRVHELPESIVWRMDRDPLYRGDDTAPAIIFENGFEPRGSSTSIIDQFAHQPNRGFVSTSRRFGFPNRLPRHVYVLDAPGGVDLPETVGSPRGEHEISFPGGVRSEYIRGVYSRRWWRLDEHATQGEWMPNPRYRGKRGTEPDEPAPFTLPGEDGT